MAQRRPPSSHPAFVPIVALWFAALFGLVIAVLPERMFAGLGTGPAVLSTGAAFVGAGLGWAIGGAVSRRGRPDPRPLYEELEASVAAPPPVEPARRPLRVREELGEVFATDASADDSTDWRAPEEPGPARNDRLAGDSFMILTPQPVHPPQPAPDLDALLAQFDNAIAAFRREDGVAQPPPPPPAHRFDPVRAFVARQTGGPAPTPLGGPMPDHQAELRSALDKLARARGDD